MSDAELEAALRNEMAEDDPHHPLSVLGTWTMMIAEDYGIELPLQLDLTYCGGFLDRNLHRIAQDPEQDFPLLRNETRKVLDHLEAVLQNSMKPERGAPCPECAAERRVERMTRSYPHWCDDGDCHRIHYSVTMDANGEWVPDTAGDEWTCPRGHSRSHEDYQRWIEERHDTSA